MPDPKLDALLQHSSWVRALAHNLARDPGLAEDIVQETWVSALRRGPRDARSLRGWLATLLRRHLRQIRRGEARRALREERHARALAEPSTAEVVERAESGRALAQAVLELREPFRSTVLLRYFEELSPDEIATRMGVPVPTVHSRLGRGLAALRQRLGREREARRGWAGGFAWLARLAGAPTQRAPRTLLPLLPLAAAGVALLLGTWLVARTSADGGPPRDRLTARLEPAASSLELGTALGTSGAREAVPAAPPHAGGSIDAPRPERSGSVLDITGAPVAGVEIVLVPSQPEGAAAEYRTRSAADGSFRFPAPSGNALLRAQDASHETVMMCQVDPERAGDSPVVVAPKVSLAGHVRRPDGEPVAGAFLELRIDPRTALSYERALDFNRPERWIARSGADGAFRFESAPGLAAGLFVAPPGRPPETLLFTGQESDALEIVLQPPPPGTRTVRGLVTDASGRPVAGAEVTAFPAATRSDERGSFELALWPAPLRSELVVVQPGRSAVALSIARDDARAPLWPEFSALRLPARSGEVAGVVRSGGRPVAGARVWLADPTPALVGEGGILFAESLTADPATGPWRAVTSADDGSFVLGGLLAREYQLCAADPATLVLDRRAVRPGERVDLELPAQAAVRVAGRVVDASGRALAGVAVRLQRNVLRATFGEHQAEGLALPPVVTDAEGRFEFARASRRGTFVQLSSDRIMPVTYALDALEGAGELSLVASLRAHLRVELSDDGDADAFEARDEVGQRLALIQLRESCSHPHERAPLAGGRSVVLAVAAGARDLVFFRGDEEVGSLPVVIEPGRLNHVQW